MKSINLFVPCSGDNLLRLEEEYAYCGRDTIRVEGGLSVLAFPKRKPKKKAPVQNKRRESNKDEEKRPTNREQRPKSRA